MEQDKQGDNVSSILEQRRQDIFSTRTWCLTQTVVQGKFSGEGRDAKIVKEGKLEREWPMQFWGMSENGIFKELKGVQKNIFSGKGGNGKMLDSK